MRDNKNNLNIQETFTKDCSIQIDGIYDLDKNCLSCNSNKYFNYYNNSVNYNYFFILIMFILIIN